MHACHTRAENTCVLQESPLGAALGGGCPQVHSSRPWFRTGHLWSAAVLLYQAGLFFLTSGGIKISLMGWGFFPSGGPQSSVYHGGEGVAVGVGSGWPHRICRQEGGRDEFRLLTIFLFCVLCIQSKTTAPWEAATHTQAVSSLKLLLSGNSPADTFNSKRHPTHALGGCLHCQVDDQNQL